MTFKHRKIYAYMHVLTYNTLTLQTPIVIGSVTFEDNYFRLVFFAAIKGWETQ